MFALLRRTFRFMDSKTIVPLYKTLVRTHLDFASVGPLQTKTYRTNRIRPTKSKETTARHERSIILRKVKKVETPNPII